MQACKLGLGDLSKPTAPANFFGVKLMSVGVMLMFVGIMNFGQVQKIRFVVVKIFWSNSNQFLVILICKLVSLNLHLNYFTKLNKVDRNFLQLLTRSNIDIHIQRE